MFKKRIFIAIEIVLAALIAVLPLAAATPAWAAGSNPTSPAPTPATPATLVTKLPALTTVGQGGCVQQYDDRLNQLNSRRPHLGRRRPCGKLYRTAKRCRCRTFAIWTSAVPKFAESAEAEYLGS